MGNTTALKKLKRLVLSNFASKRMENETAYVAFKQKAESEEAVKAAIAAAGNRKGSPLYIVRGKHG